MLSEVQWRSDKVGSEWNAVEAPHIPHTTATTTENHIPEASCRTRFGIYQAAHHYLTNVKCSSKTSTDVCTNQIRTIMSFSTATSPTPATSITQRPLIIAFLICFLTFWTISFAGTTDAVNWWIENLLVIIFTTTILLTFKRFSFSDLSYAFMLFFLILHVYGAKYAYADNPFGFWIQQHFNTVRNPYDRLVHASFGLLMSYPMRELLMRRMNTSERWSWILPAEMVISLSAIFELIEWSIADVFFPAHGKNYVGTQGDIWDAQKDIFMASCGAIVAMTVGYLIKRATAQYRMRSMQLNPAEG